MTKPIARVADAVRPVLESDGIASARQQLSVAGGQVAAGALNLAFAIIAARLLEPREFAHLAAFLALYVLLHVFAGSLGAGMAIDPGAVVAGRGRLFGAGVAMLIAGVVLVDPLAAVTGLPPGLVLALCVAAPAAGVLAAERGGLYGRARYGTAIASLLAEPVVRLSVGIVLAILFGPRGAALAIVLAGWVALALLVPVGMLRPIVERLVGRVESALSDGAGGSTTGADPAIPVQVSSRHASLTFLAMAVVLHQDLLLATRLLPTEQAAAFAVVSTLGGLAAFATTTVPFVLLGQERTRASVNSALATAAVLGLGAVMTVGFAPRLFVGLLFGDRYAAAESLALPYLAAMALYGIARVLAAHLCLGPRSRWVPRIAASGALLQCVAIIVVGTSPGWIVLVTLSTTAGLVLALGALHVADGRAVSAPAPNEPPTPVAATPAGALPVRPLPPGSATRPALPPGRTPPAGLFGRWAGYAAPRAAEAIRRGHAVAGVASRTVRQAAADAQPALVRARVRGAALASSRVRFTRDAAIVAGLFAVGVVVRAAIFRSLWLDEAISALQTRLGFTALIDILRFTDVHPPLHAVVLWATVRAAGSSELALRAPSIVAGALVVPALYVAGRELYDRHTGLVAAVLGVVAPFLVWYSQEARMYALFSLFGLIAVVAQMRALRTGRRIDWIVYVVASAALLWTHYFGLLQVIVQQAIFVVVILRDHRTGLPDDDGRARNLWREWIMAGAWIAALCVPLVPYATDQVFSYLERRALVFDVPTQAGLLNEIPSRLSVYGVIANVVWSITGYHNDAVMAQLAALWPLGMLGLLFLLGRRSTRWTFSTIALAAGPPFFLALLGLVRRDLFEVRYVAATVPLLLLLGARLVTGVFANTRVRMGVAALCVVGLSAALVDQQLNRTNPRFFDFGGTFETVSGLARPGDLLLYEPYYLEPVVDYYVPQIASRRAGGAVPEAQRVFVVSSFQESPEVAERTRLLVAGLSKRYGPPRTIEQSRVSVWLFD